MGLNRYNFNMTNIIFFGSSQYSVVILQKLLEIKDFQIAGVFTKLDKPVGRRQEIIPNPVATFAKQNNLNLLQIETFTPEVKLEIRNLKLDIGICVAFGPPYFDQEVIDIPKYKIVNIHPSPLPKYRGATPGPWQIINGETKSAVTFFQIDALPDHGPIISQIPFEISPTETATSFYNKAFDLAANNLEKILKNYLFNPKKLIDQNHDQRSYFPKFDKDKAKINWGWDNTKIERFIRALTPWPIAWTFVTDQKSKALKMKVFSFNTEPIIVQIEGKTKTKWSEISKYYQIKK
jgi:methionyl-tRNA formyltransferase